MPMAMAMADADGPLFFGGVLLGCYGPPVRSSSCWVDPASVSFVSSVVTARHFLVAVFSQALFSAVVLSPHAAAAEEGEGAASGGLSPAPGLSGPVGPPPLVGAHVHDGFYLMAAPGFGVYDERLESGRLPGGSVEARNRGVASLSNLAIGGTIAPGWVLGGLIYSSDLVASTFRTSGDSLTTLPQELDPGLRSMSLIAPFFDYYPNVRGGFHVQGALGLAILTPRIFGHPATERSEYAAVGGGFIVGTGYDWWVADEWSIGVLSQLGLSVLSGEDDAGVKWTHIITSSPSLCVSLTYH